MLQNNPLQRYFRQPAIHIRLPSQGKFYPPGTLEVPPNGEIPIFPMTALDEITSRTPDALYNGSAIVDIVASCAPNIKDPWDMPVIDISALLASIRLASYGHEMDISTTCPKCGNIQEVIIDLRTVLDQIQPPDYSKSISIGDLTVYFQPMSYRQLNDLNRVQFEDQKIVNMLNNTQLSNEEKIQELGTTFKRIARLTVTSYAASISTIKTPDAIVNELNYIEDFLSNCPKPVFNLIKTHISELREVSDLKPFDMTCEECQHQYKQEFTLDMSNFFETAS